MSGFQQCYTLYPSGTLGRVFIDVALEFITSLQPLSLQYSLDTLCINNTSLLTSAINTVIQQLWGRRGVSFPLTGNDAKSIKKRVLNFDEKDSVTIVDYILDLINKGGFNRLRETLTAPSIMRIEFYEYAKTGYTQYWKTTTHPYREASVLDLGLSVLGSLITCTAEVRIKDDIRYYYFIPLIKPINLMLVKDLKNIIGNSISIYINQSKSLDIINTLKIASVLSKNLKTDINVGELVVIKKLGKRYSLISRELINTSGWIWLFNKIDPKSIGKINLIVDIIDHIMKTTGYKSLSPLYEVLDELYRYVLCDESALYRAIRTLNIVIDALKRVEEKKEASEEWMNIYNYLRDVRKIRDPLELLNSLIRDLSSLAEITPCQERVVL